MLRQYMNIQYKINTYNFSDRSSLRSALPTILTIKKCAESEKALRFLFLNKNKQT